MSVLSHFLFSTFLTTLLEEHFELILQFSVGENKSSHSGFFFSCNNQTCSPQKKPRVSCLLPQVRNFGATQTMLSLQSPRLFTVGSVFSTCMPDFVHLPLSQELKSPKVLKHPLSASKFQHLCITMPIHKCIICRICTLSLVSFVPQS